MTVASPTISRLSRRLLRRTRLGNALSSGLNRIGLQHAARVTSRHTDYVPEIVSFDHVGNFRLPGNALRMSSAQGDDHIA